MDTTFNLAEIFTPEMSFWEILLRAVVLYFFVLFILRILPRRTMGELGAMDLVFILLIAEAASNALGNFKSLGDGILIILVFIACNYGVNQLSYHYKFIERILQYPPVPIVREGKLLLKNMRKELLTKDELQASMREEGIEDLSEIKLAHVESEGHISFITYEKTL